MTHCTDLTKKSTVCVGNFFCFVFIQSLSKLHCTSHLYSQKKKKKRAKQRQVKESLTMIPIFAFQFRALYTIVQLEVSHVINK